MKSFLLSDHLQAILDLDGRTVCTKAIVSTEFMWTDGNYSCDCNRSIFMNEADPTIPLLECGSQIQLLGLK